MSENMKVVMVTNRGTGPVGYKIPEKNIRRQFMPGEKKKLAADEVEYLAFNTPGGKKLIEKYLVVEDLGLLNEVMSKVEPEYFYTVADAKRMVTTATLDEFLDCLDFAPQGVIDMIEELAITTPLSDMNKRKALEKKTGLDITRVIEEHEEEMREKASKTTESAPTRRTAAPTVEAVPERRASAPQFSFNKPVE